MSRYIKTQDLLNQDTLTYQQILNLKKRFQGYTKNKDIKYNDAEFKEEYKITPEHTAKGFNWLMNVALKPSKFNEAHELYPTKGIQDKWLRKNCPLGYRELNILFQFDHFTFTGFYDATNMYQRDMGLKTLYPLWKCYDKDGYSFEYYLEAGSMNIIG